MRTQTLVFVLVVLAGCNSGPEPIVQGRDECAHCRMLISDVRFAAQFVTDRGRYEKFDSIECLLNGMRDGSSYRSVWVSNLAHPGQWLDAETATFIRNPDIRSPMGGGLAAFGTVDEARSLTDSKPMTWRELAARL